MADQPPPPPSPSLTDLLLTGGAGVASGAGSSFLTNQGTQAGNNTITTKGNTTALQSILNQIMQSATPAGMAAMVGNNNAIGMGATPSAVLGTTGAPVQTAANTKAIQDDMAARLGNVATALLSNQQNLAANVATKYADQTKTQQVVQSSGGCFITTAICEGLGLPDDCEELQVLRTWRDVWLRESTFGSTLIDLYYDVAPVLIKQLKVQEVSQEMLGYLRTRFILPAVAAIKSGNNDEAFQLYVAMLRYVIDLLALI